ncbi:MAG: hypothetical protein QM796_01260 [Chthoniobacteraceae bacterium]
MKLAALALLSLTLSAFAHDPNHGDAKLVSDGLDVFSKPTPKPEPTLDPLAQKLSAIHAVQLRGLVLSVLPNGRDVIVDCPETFGDHSPSFRPTLYTGTESQVIDYNLVPGGRVFGTFLLKTPAAMGQLADGDPISVVALSTNQLYRDGINTFHSYAVLVLAPAD